MHINDTPGRQTTTSTTAHARHSRRDGRGARAADGRVGVPPHPAQTAADASNTATVYYSTATTGWTTVNIHYAPAGGSWTTVPGVGMEPACTGWWKKTLDISTASSLKAAFNNGNGVWDNNNSSDYTIPTGISTVKDRTVTVGTKDPCAAEAPDTQAPTTPPKVTASAANTSVVVSWEAATDDRGVAKYRVTRTGGSKGTVVTDVTSTVFSDTGLEEKTTYTYTVQALDAAGNTSPASAAATATTGEKAPAPAAGTPLGTDPRKDPIYFVLTARFHDGDSSNNRGGSQHVKSGNAANNDPMFRGDSRHSASPRSGSPLWSSTARTTTTTATTATTSTRSTRAWSRTAHRTRT